MEDRSEMKCPTMRSIRELAGYTFVIPVYQRGFRWTKQQIKELIDDLLEFSNDNKSSGKTYCLQNVTVRKTGEKTYEVIDGQQRLTAIWLLIIAFMDSSGYYSLRQSGVSMPVYNLKYIGKKSITEYVEKVNDFVKEEKDLKESILDISPYGDGKASDNGKKDIDASLIYDGLKYIMGGYISYENTPYALTSLSIFNNNFFAGTKQISVIWNEITPVGEGKEAQEKYVIERFSNLNANKIPLTESELIKAYFIDQLYKENKKENDKENNLHAEKIQEFSLQWEEMERGFNNDEFWWFLSSGKDEETRLDMLFRIYLNLDQAGEQHALSRKIREKIDKENAEEVWKKIIQIYDTLRDWYSDYYYYHVIGLIIAIEDAAANSIISVLYDKYQKSSKRKFKGYLKKRIRCEKIFKIPFQSDEKDDWNIENPEEILLEGDDNSEISYVKNKACVKPILLLFNISLLLNAYNVNPENAAERFSFKLYKNKNNPIEIEHINPKHLEGGNARGTKYNAEKKKKWAEETIEIITDKDRREELEKKANNANWDNKNATLIEEIEDAAHVNSLSNLTLLDKNLNSSYGDNFFDEKRKHILAARFGYSIPGVISEGDSKEYYKQSVIFPGTMLVFMRQYKTNSDEDLDAGESKRWDAKDRANYITCMQESIFRFLSPIKPTVDESDGE